MLEGIEFGVTCMIVSDVNGSLGDHNDRGRKPIGFRDNKCAIQSLKTIAKVRVDSVEPLGGHKGNSNTSSYANYGEIECFERQSNR